MSGSGPILNNIPQTNDPLGPSAPQSDPVISEAFGRKVSPSEPETKYLLKLAESPLSNTQKYHGKSLGERTVKLSDPESGPQLNPEKTTHSPSASGTKSPSEELAAHSLVSTNNEISLKESTVKVDDSSIDLKNNFFLKEDGKTLKSQKETKTTGRRPSLGDVVNQFRSMTKVHKALTGKSSLSDNVLIGFDKVANYNNQGIPSSYLQKMQEVADEQGVLIAVRPVEKICRTLIEEGYGSKGLHIKGKSSNWGPMAGFIPVNQHFSKLSGNPEKVATYNQKNHDAIHVKKNAPQEQLHISSRRIEELEGMGILTNAHNTEPTTGYHDAVRFEAAPKNGPLETFEAHLRPDGQWDVFSGSGNSREKLMVIPLTADFDLLFVHSHYEDVDLGQQDKKQPFHPTLGIVSEKTTSVIDALNTKFDRGGPDRNMVHHGADTENPVTEMEANFPASVVIPQKMLSKLGLYNDSPILIKNERELARFYRAMQAGGIKVDTNPLWDHLKSVKAEIMEEKISKFGGRRKSI